MIEIKNVTKIYKDGSVGIKNISLTLPNKGLVVIEGKSGSGKSTLLNLLSGMMNPTDGEILFDKKDIRKVSNYKDSVGMIFQDFNLITDLNVVDNISFIGNSKSEELIKLLNIEDLKKKKTHEISGGEARRVAIARALNKGVKVLLCDEPTESLDKENEDNILNILKDISKDILVVVVSHKESIRKYADRIITISKGLINEDKLINEGEYSVVKSNSKRNLSITKLFKIAVSRLLDSFGLFTLNLVSLILVFTLFLGAMVLREIDLDELEAKTMITNNEHRLIIDDYYHDSISRNIINDLGVNYNEVYTYFLSGQNFSFTLGHLESGMENIGAFYLSNIGAPEVVVIKNQTFLDSDEIVGALPVNANEVLISEYTFEGFKMFGVKTLDGEFKTYANIEDVIGETLLIGEQGVKITGVLRQNIGAYEAFKDVQFVFGYGQEVYFSMFNNSVTNLNYLYVTSEFDEYLESSHKSLNHYLVNSDNLSDLVSVKKLDSKRFEVRGAYTGNLFSLRKLIKRLNIFGTIVLIVFSVIGFIFISNYFGNSIQNHEKDNRVLKYLGLGNFMVFMPYLIEVFLLTLISSCFSSLIVGIICRSLNNFYDKILFCDMTLFNISLTNIGYFGLFVLIIIFVLSLLSIFRINKSIKKYTE